MSARAQTARPRIAGLVLAAGESRRMGPDNKLLREIDGAPLVCRAVDAFLASEARPVVVATGHESDAVGAVLADRPVSLVHNERYRDGLSGSLRVGVDALPSDADAVVVGLGDMPWVRARHVDALIDAFDPVGGSAICVPTHEGRRGNPVLWSARYFDELRALRGDVGARALLTEHARLVRGVEVADAGVLRDVDTPSALARSG